MKLTESDLSRIVRRVINEQKEIIRPWQMAVSPKIIIDCKLRRIMKSDLPDNLEGKSYYNIVDHFCEKYKDNIRKDV